MQPPTEAKWKEIARGFQRRWNFPNCAGAVDGKHVKITCPKSSGSIFYNYKVRKVFHPVYVVSLHQAFFQGTFSIVLMAVVDSEYKFVLIDVGAEGRQSDSGVFKASAIGHHLESGTLRLPGVSALPGTDITVPQVFIGDEAFQLRVDFLRPYPARELTSEKRVFNFRLSSAR